MKGLTAMSQVIHETTSLKKSRIRIFLFLTVQVFCGLVLFIGIKISQTINDEFNRVNFDQMVWSPNGQQILLHISSRYLGNQVLSLDVNSSKLTDLSINNAYELVWSPNSRLIAFSANTNLNRDIYVTDNNGSNQTKVTNSASFDGMPTWAPNNDQLAFVSARNGSRQIYVMNKDGSEVQRLPYTHGELSYPLWSPDGNRIVFLSTTDLCDRKVLIIELSLFETTEITNQCQAYLPPIWSPDSKKIAFKENTGNKQGILHIYFLDTLATKSIIIKSTYYPLLWSPNSKRILLHDDLGLMIISLETLSVDRIPIAENANAFWNADNNISSLLISSRLDNNFQVTTYYLK